MSIHPSLSSSEKHKKPRSVLKRTERMKIMLDKGEWKEGDEVYGLPKIKTLRIKIKKEKTAEKVEAATTQGAATAEAPVEAKAPSKGATPRAQEKK